MSDDGTICFPAGIETERLSSRPIGVADAGVLFALTNDPTILNAISFLPGKFTLTDAEDLVRLGMGPKDRFWCVRERGETTLVGVIGAHLKIPLGIEIGYWIGSAFHGQGIATEAGRGLIGALRRVFPGYRIFAECRPENAASWRVLHKLGFRPTGEDGARAGRKRLELAD